MNNFEGDSAEYEMLTEGVKLSSGIYGMCCEIGLRLGKGMATIIDAMAEYCPGKIALSVDPYGSILYQGREHQLCRLDYTMTMRNICLSQMYPYAQEKNIHYKFIELTDIDFFDKYRGGVIVYDLERVVLDKYSFVHLDGPHDVKSLCVEIDWFSPKMLLGSVICLDDITPDFFDVTKVEEHMGNRFELIIKGQKKGLWKRTSN